MAAFRDTTITPKTHSRREMLTLAGGLAAATAAAGAVAIQAARAEPQPDADAWRAMGFRSPMEHLVHRWWMVENAAHEACKGLHTDEEFDAVLDAISDQQHEIEELILDEPVRDLYDAGLVATICFQKLSQIGDLADHLRAGLRPLGFGAHL